jgi:hypothetical protein
VCDTEVVSASAPALLDVARTQGVHVLIARRWPGPAMDEVVRDAVVTDMARRRELIRVLEALGRAGVRPLVFKGAALARSHYPLPAARPHLDVDLLVPETQVDAAAAAIEACGYTRPLRIPGELIRSQAPLVRTDPHGVMHTIDLHWQISKPQVFGHVLSWAELDAQAVALPAFGAGARAPGAVHALAIACIHRVAHHHGPERDKLIWLYDVHLLAGRLTTEEADAFAALAKHKRIAAICADGMMLACEHFRTRLPAGLLEALTRAAADDPHEPSAAYLRAGMRRVDVLLSDLSALPSWTQRAHLLREHLFPPASYMREAYGLRGRACLPAVYAWRAVTGAVRWLVSDRSK